MNKVEVKMDEKTVQYYITSLEDLCGNLQEENEQLQQKVNQLETSNTSKDEELLQLKEELRQLKANIDEAIRVLKDSGCYDEDTKTFCDDVWEELPYILSTLERGKE